MGTECRAGESAAARYRPCRPSQGVLYRCVQQHLETWLAQCRKGYDDDAPVPPYVERKFRRYLDCGIPARGLARARCGQCGHDFVAAFSCQTGGVCPSCNARRMVATAAHLTDQVLPPLPVRQWALTVPKRLRYFLQHDADLQGAALRLFLRVVEQCLRAPALASVPARNQHDKLAEQPVAAASHRLTRTTDLTSIRLARLKSLSVIADLSCGFEFETPIQCAPDLVRHLMGKNIAIYQLVRIARGRGSWRQ